MPRRRSLSLAAACAVIGFTGVTSAQDRTADTPPIVAVPINSVRLEDPFWAPRIETLRSVSIPLALDACETSGRIENFQNAALAMSGQSSERLPANPFDDADVYKVIEAASHTLAWHPDASLDASLDEIIRKIAAAQEPDGYLYTARTINPAQPHSLAGAERWISEKADSYELSNLAYLYDAAVAHFAATGKRTLLEVAIRSADLLDNSFGPGKKSIWPGHEGIEAALVRLSTATGEPRYFALAKFLLDERGPAATAPNEPARGRGNRRGRGNLNQSQQKIIEQTTATGNAVDAARLYAGVAAVAARSGDANYAQTVEAIWSDVAGRKLYITGGIGAVPNDGSFGRNYLLPNSNAASTSAASAANALWQQQMFQLRGEAKYADLLERTIYNALAAAISYDGKQYFDANVLESLGRQQRRTWPPTGGRRGNTASTITQAASPIGALRVIAAVPGMVYATQGNAIYVNLYAAGSADIRLSDALNVKIEQRSQYPWDGAIRLTLNPSAPSKFPLKLRIPGWARNEVVASELYRFADSISEPVLATVNGTRLPVELNDGYLTIEKSWSAGDVVELTLPMPVRRVVADDQVAENAERVAVQRGPIVYCAQGSADPPIKVRNLVLPDDAQLKAAIEAKALAGAVTISGQAAALHLDEEDRLTRTPNTLSAIPYCLWANQGPAEMLVWLPNRDAMAVPTATPNLAATARISGSAKQSGQAIDARAAKDGIESRSSHDNSPLSHFDWWPDRSSTVWCEYTWDQPQTIKQTQLYWWDDSTTGGGCKVPASWKALYKKGDEWLPVETQDEYGVAADKYNRVSFMPVETTALRVEIVIRDDASVGIQEWKVR